MFTILAYSISLGNIAGNSSAIFIDYRQKYGNHPVQLRISLYIQYTCRSVQILTIVFGTSVVLRVDIKFVIVPCSFHPRQCGGYHDYLFFFFFLGGRAGQGAKQLYRVAVHPFLMQREAQIDAGISKLGSTGLDALRRVSKEGLSFAATAVVTTAMRVRGEWE